MITINTNTTAMVAQNNLLNTQSNLNDSMQKLSTGLRINSASDDAAGMQISNRMETQINGLEVAQRNTNDAISMAQTAEGAMTEITDMMNRMRDLSLQSANDTNTTEDRNAMQKEMDALATEITRVADKTDFAGIDILKGKGTADTEKEFSFQVGADANETISFTIGNMSAESLGTQKGVTTIDTGTSFSTDVGVAGDHTTTGFYSDVSVEMTDGSTQTLKLTGLNNADAHDLIEKQLGVDATVTVSTAAGTKDKIAIADGEEIFAGVKNINGTAATSTSTGVDIRTGAGAQAAVETLDKALATVDAQRADLGAVQNRLESTIDNLSNIQENMSASQSRIKDVDFAKETTNMTSQQMMMQAGSTILSQAKSMPQYATQLLG